LFPVCLHPPKICQRFAYLINLFAIAEILIRFKAHIVVAGKQRRLDLLTALLLVL
jgi:hypothetical protein